MTPEKRPAEPEPTGTDTGELIVFELEVWALDRPSMRRRWNGDPMASPPANDALLRAVDAFTASLRHDAFQIARTGFGVRAVKPEASDDA